MLDWIGRLTVWMFVDPDRYVDRGKFWSGFDLEQWSEYVYDWKQDSWDGLKDTVSDPRVVVETGRGDCDDYANVAVSTLLEQTDGFVGLAFMSTLAANPTGHVVAYTDTHVYSSGEIYEGSLNDFMRQSQYDVKICRTVRSS